MARRPLSALALALLGALACEVRAGEPTDADLRREFAALVKKGDHEGLLRAADTALTSAPESLPALEHRAFALQKIGHAREAARAYAAVLEQKPDHAWALTQLGWLESDFRRYDASARYLRAAIALKPESLDAHRKLVAVLRASGDVEGALTQVAASRDAGLDASWAWREECELEWMTGDADSAAIALREAGKLGAENLDRLRALIAFDREILRREEDDDAFRAQRAAGTPWEFDIGEVHVVSTVGPFLPTAVERMLSELPERFADLVGRVPERRGRGRGPRQPAQLVLHVSRTTEQHEVLRRRLFPQGSRGRAFTAGTSGQRNRGATGQIGIYVAWTAPDVHTSIAHELGHAAIRRVAFGVPVWLDEGIATYVENLRTRDDDAEPWRDDLRGELTRGLRNDRVLSWAQMISAQRGNFESAHGRERYAQAWSMVRFLLHDERMGSDAAARRERLRSVLSPRPDGPFRVAGSKALLAATYGMSVGEIDDAWRVSIGAPRRR